MVPGKKYRVHLRGRYIDFLLQEIRTIQTNGKRLKRYIGTNLMTGRGIVLNSVQKIMFELN